MKVKETSSGHTSNSAGFTSQASLIAIVVVVGVLYYTSTWLLDYMKETKHARMKARGLVEETVSVEDAEYLSDLY